MSTDSCGIINAAIHAHTMVSGMISFYLNIAKVLKRKSHWMKFYWCTESNQNVLQFAHYYSNWFLMGYFHSDRILTKFESQQVSFDDIDRLSLIFQASYLDDC